MVLVRTIARDAPGLGREKGTIVQDEGQGITGMGSWVHVMLDHMPVHASRGYTCDVR